MGKDPRVLLHFTGCMAVGCGVDSGSWKLQILVKEVAVT